MTHTPRLFFGVLAVLAAAGCSTTASPTAASSSAATFTFTSSFTANGSASRSFEQLTTGVVGLTLTAASPDVRLGIGLHTGTVMMGTVGEPERMEATVLSDDVNIAARIEALTKHYDAHVVCSEQTLMRIDPAARQMRSFGHVRIQGTLRDIAIVERIEADPDPVRARKQASAPEFAAGLERLRRADFAAANVHFQRVLDADASDGAARLYLQRAADGLAARTSAEGGPPER